MSRLKRCGGVAVAGVVAALGCGGAAVGGTPQPPAVRELVGSVRLMPGACHHGRPTGSYLAVTFGTRAIRNRNSNCDGGAVTLLHPSGPLSTQHYATAAGAAFNHRALTLLTAPGSGFRPPHLYLVGSQLQADVRSMEAGYGGGWWQIGGERASGTYDAASHQVSLQWFSGQSFTSASAGTQLRLAGRFVGTIKRVPAGTTVQLGTASFSAGGTAVAHDAAARAVHSGQRPNKGAVHPHRGRRRRAADSTGARSPKAFLLAEILVLLNIVAFAGLSRKRGRK